MANQHTKKKQEAAPAAAKIDYLKGREKLPQAHKLPILQEFVLVNYSYYFSLQELSAMWKAYEQDEGGLVVMSESKMQEFWAWVLAGG